jgi:hypothetical protein
MLLKLRIHVTKGAAGSEGCETTKERIPESKC